MERFAQSSYLLHTAGKLTMRSRAHFIFIIRHKSLCFRKKNYCLNRASVKEIRIIEKNSGNFMRMKLFLMCWLLSTII
jgi:hypothetical protein